MTHPFLKSLQAFKPTTQDEQKSKKAFKQLLNTTPAPFSRALDGGGHFTGSALILSPDKTSILLTHHVKLGIWIQLGGHCDDIEDPFFVAHKEAYEESGLALITPLSSDIFSLTCDPVPTYKDIPEHTHFDSLYLFQAKTTAYTVSHESHDLQWVPLTNITDYTQEQKMLDMTRKIRDALS